MTAAALEVLKQYWPEKIVLLEAAEEVVRCNNECIEADNRAAPANHCQHLEYAKERAVDKLIAATERSLIADGRDDLYQRSQRVR